MVALAEQISAYKRLLPQLRRDHGSAWAVVVDSKVAGAFPDFPHAARFAMEHFAGQQYLIRHTDEVEETLPFVLIED